ncbi:hypothetical protein D3C71_1790130 [compost metagenome]
MSNIFRKKACSASLPTVSIGCTTNLLLLSIMKMYPLLPTFMSTSSASCFRLSCKTNTPSPSFRTEDIETTVSLCSFWDTGEMTTPCPFLTAFT